MNKRLLIYSMLAIAGILLVVTGCVAADKAAEGGQQLLADPTLRAVVESTVPFGGPIIAVASLLIAMYQGIRKRQWKSAFTTVVNTVEPYIPSDEASRTALRARQGTDVANKVKAVKK